jgi:predicted AAA+ superfamily ATPase
VRRAVDEGLTGGQFLLTGSAPFGESTMHSGAGRITALRMRPFTLIERGLTVPTVSIAELLAGQRVPIAGECRLSLSDYTDAILASGFPGMRHLSGRALRNQLDSYLEGISDRELEEAGLRVRRPATVRAWLRAYAAATSTVTSWEKIRAAATPGDEAKPARSTTAPYVDILTALRILDEVDAWLPQGSHLTRVGQRAKHHLADPALAARLLGLTREDLLSGRGGFAEIPRDGPFLGALFESLATLSIRVFAQAAEATVAHLRIPDGRHEIDLVVERDDGAVVAIEVKLSPVIGDKDLGHLRWLAETIGDRLLDSVVITTGPQAYRRPDGIAVVPLGLMGP